MALEALSLEALTTVAGASILTSLIVELIKRTWAPPDDIRDRFVPLISVIVGIIVVLLAVFGLSLGGREEIIEGIITGIFAGFAASGIYATTKAVAKSAGQ